MPAAQVADQTFMSLESDGSGLLARGTSGSGTPVDGPVKPTMASTDPPPKRRERRPNRLLMTSFGYNNAGGGTTVPRLVSKELVRRGWEVTVFYAAVEPADDGRPYAITESEADGVQLVGVHNRPSGLFDITRPLRELDDPAITAAFGRTLEEARPEVVHFHNLHNLGAKLIDQVAVRGLPSYFTTHNYWLICPRAYLLQADGGICPGPGDGAACARCTGALETTAYQRRLAEIRSHAQSGLTRILAVSESVRHTFLAAGYDPALIDVVRQAMPHDMEIWQRVGAHREPGRKSEQLTVAFIGSAYPHKGPQLLVAAAQQTATPIRVKLIGEVRSDFAKRLSELDTRNCVEFTGAFAPSELPVLLSDVDVAALPSMWRDCAPLAAAECKAARLPLLVPRLGGLAETVEPGVDGLTFEPFSAEDLAVQIDRIATEPGLLERLQANIGPPPSFAAYVDELEAYYSGEREQRDEGAAPAGAARCVRWQGDLEKLGSLAIINEQVSSRLPAPLELVAPNRRRISPPAVSAAAVEVHHQWPPDLNAPPAGSLATIVPWEFGSVPVEWVREINANVDELWVPSEFVRQMYVRDGVEAERVVTIPNGVDLELFSPAPAPLAREQGQTRFLFVGGLIPRKGPDVLLEAYKRAFPDRDDVLLVIKDFGSGGVYKRANREPILSYAASGRLPRVEVIEDELDEEEIVELYRSADVLVHPYRGEGFAMPVLEAMACGLPVITTGGGPTDEFCPPEAGWRIRAHRREFDEPRISKIDTVTTPWQLEPSQEHLVTLLRQAQENPDERRRRGQAARAAAQALSWDAVAQRYEERIVALSGRPTKLGAPAVEPFPFTENVTLRVLATPAWRGEDELGALLHDWATYTTPESDACLYLLADPAVAGAPGAIEAHVLGAAQRGGADLEHCADVNVLMESFSAKRDRRLLAGVNAYVALHPGCAGWARLAHTTGREIMAPGGEPLRRLLAAGVYALP